MRLRQAILWSGIATLGVSPVFGQTLAGAMFPAGTAPSGCQAIAGLFPVGAHTAQLWEYDSYAMVMPPYKKKRAQSFQCGADKGTLYFFDYASAGQKDRALLFAQPVLAKQNAGHPLPIRDWSTGFVVISFAHPPQEVLNALDARLSPGGMPAAPTPKPLPPVSSTAPAKQAPPPPVTETPTSPSPVSEAPAYPSKSSTQNVQAPDGMTGLKPSIAAHPFEPSKGEKALTAASLPPPPAPVARVPEPPKPPSPPREHPHPVAHKPAMPRAPAAPAPANAADLSSSLLETFASKMGCESPDRNVQTQTVCGFMQEFASGLPPELPFKAETLMGPVYVIDVNGRFTNLHYDAFSGSPDANVVSLFTLPSTGGKDDFEIKQLIEARKAKAPLPQNDTRVKLPALEAAKRMTLRKSTARSVILQPTPARKLFIRRAGDHLIIIGVSGDTPATQQNGSLDVCVLY